ncbi:phospho-N-acetylmuramoyl-pentapeptide-transferase [bacterium]|nr:phospho-N-acetylmuramoyl-pentapeptide-transferase [bacterium]
MNELFHLSRILGLTAVSFILAILLTPLWSKFLRKYNLVKKKIHKERAPIFTSLHKKKEGTPTMGGVLIWGTVLMLTAIIWYLSKLFPETIFHKLNFLSRGQTLLPLGALIASAIVGVIDDLLGIFKENGLKVRHRLIIYTLIASFGAWWFYWKLEWDLIHIPFIGNFNIGIWYIFLFIFILVATAFSVNETDGLDGLAGGVLLVAFATYGIIAFSQGRMDLAVLCGVIIGALLAFLWFNIYPAKFFMGDTGSMSLGITLGVIAMLTNQFLLLPFIGFVLVIESASVILQILSKKIRKKKIFLSSPIHHHLEAIGWPETRITERLWIISGVMAGIGLILVFVEKML